MVALAYPFWPLATLLVCVGFIIAALATRLRTTRTRALTILLLAIGADAALSLGAVAATSSPTVVDADVARAIAWLPLFLPALVLWFTDVASTSGRGRVAPLLTALALLAITPAAQSGAFLRVFSGMEPQPGDLRLVVIAALAQAGAWTTTFVALVVAYRRHRDPFERNRMKYTGVAICGLCLGTLYYWLQDSDGQSMRHAANAAGAGLLGVGVLRYRLPDSDAAIRRSVGHLLVAVPTSFMYVGALVMLMRAFDMTIASATGMVLAVALGFAAALVAVYMRSVAAMLLEHPLLARQRDREERVAALVRESGTVRSVRDLAEAVTRSCETVLDMSFVTLLASAEAGRPLRVLDTRGLAPRPGLNISISSDNVLLSRLGTSQGTVTPFALASLLDAGDVSPTAAAEFGSLRDCVLSPLVSQGRVIGLIAVGPRVGGRAYRLSDLDFLAAVASHSALSFQNAQLIEQLRDAALTDFITGLPNHRQLQDQFTELLDAAERRSEQLSCAIIDIDGFQHFNETYGRQAGDEALAQIAEAASLALPRGSVAGRYGGDEFLVLLPATSRREAADALAQVGAAVRALTLTPSYPPPGVPPSTTAHVSWGISTYPEDGATRRALTSVADSRLMQRKFEGRRPVTAGVGRPAAGRLLESDPEKMRIVRGLTELIGEKDPIVAERSQRVASLALLVADELHMSEQERYELWLGSLLHDLGRVGTPDSISQTTGPITIEDWETVRAHVTLGEQLVRGMLNNENISQIVACHHERHDGKGYPQGLRGEEIPRMARIVAVAGAFAAMIEDRPHVQKIQWPEAMVEIRRHSGTQFDPAIVEVFLRAVGHSSFSVAA